jgi:hypothetical protein
VLARAGINNGKGFHGNGSIWTSEWPDGTVTFRKGGPGFVEPDGSLKMKFFWLLAGPGPLTVTGKRLDGAAAALRVDMPDGFENAGFQPSSLIFPTPGCWEITAKTSGPALTFVTKIVRTF